MLYRHYTHIKEQDWPYRFFRPSELACKGNRSLLVNHDAITRLENLRRMIGRPIIITSAYRSPHHNATVGGAPMSLHKSGRAFDVVLSGHDRHLLVDAAKTVGFAGFGYYQHFLHIDTGRIRFWGKTWVS